MTPSPEERALIIDALRMWCEDPSLADAENSRVPQFVGMVIDALEAAEQQVTEMREVMRKAEWQGEGGAWEAACCPWCGGGEPLSERDQPPIYGHSDDCEFVAALREQTT